MADHSHAGKKILIVEDARHIAGDIQLNLSLQGYETEIAENGTTALSTWRRWRPDLIVPDIMLPGVDGISVLREIRSEDEKLPVLILSARSTAEDRVRGLTHGVDDYMVKPFVLEELLLRVGPAADPVGLGRPRQGRGREGRDGGPSPRLRREPGRSGNRRGGLRGGDDPVDGSGVEAAGRVRGKPRQTVAAETAPGGGVGLFPVHVHPDRRQLHRPAAEILRSGSPVAPALHQHPVQGVSLRRRRGRKVGTLRSVSGTRSIASSMVWGIRQFTGRRPKRATAPGTPTPVPVRFRPGCNRRGRG